MSEFYGESSLNIEKESSHRVTAALFGLIPGFGQFYNKQFLKGLVFSVLLFSFIGISYDFIQYGLWGITTLGEKLPDDNSIFLLAKGIISILVACLGVSIYVLSIYDAYQNGKLRDEGKSLYSVRKQFRNMIDSGFPYLMTTPAFILLVFVVIFPIVFGFAIGFTNYNLYNTPPAKLVDWVGLKNFINIFKVNLWRKTFLDVLQWTVVWTFLASTLQCSVGILF